MHLPNRTLDCALERMILSFLKGRKENEGKLCVRAWATHVIHLLQKKVIRQRKEGTRYYNEGNALYKLSKFVPPKSEGMFHCSKKNYATSSFLLLVPLRVGVVEHSFKDKFRRKSLNFVFYYELVTFFICLSITAKLFICPN